MTLHHEMELLVEAGLSSQEALEAATSLPAQLFNLDGRGEIKPGARADLVLVNADPLQGGSTLDVVAIWKSGTKIGRSEASQVPSVDRPELGLFDGSLDAPTGLVWGKSDDQIVGGNSAAEVNLSVKDDGGTNGVLAVSGEVNTTFPYPWAGAAIASPTGPAGAFSLTPHTGMTFMARGQPGSYRVMFISPRSVGAPPTFFFTMTEEWQTFSFDFDRIPGLDPANLIAISFVAGPNPGPFNFELDNVILKSP